MKQSYLFQYLRYPTIYHYFYIIGGVIGANALQGHGTQTKTLYIFFIRIILSNYPIHLHQIDVLFDWENGRIGFAESDCKVSQTRWEAEGLASEGSEARGEDCILQSPVISTPCFESVDGSICTGDNKEATLFGVETVALVVEYPGNTRIVERYA